MLTLMSRAVSPARVAYPDLVVGPGEKNSSQRQPPPSQGSSSSVDSCIALSSVRAKSKGNVLVDFDQGGHVKSSPTIIILSPQSGILKSRPLLLRSAEARTEYSVCNARIWQHRGWAVHPLDGEGRTAYCGPAATTPSRADPDPMRGDGGQLEALRRLSGLH